jgi:hypothetical protein
MGAAEGEVSRLEENDMMTERGKERERERERNRHRHIERNA